MMKALYPGTFDPVTLGHVDIVTRASRIFDQLVVGIYAVPQKNLAFTVEQRVGLMREAVRGLDKVEVVGYSGLTANFARQIGAKVLVRGLRVISDFELEYQMALTNQKLDPNIDTVCLMTSLEYAFVSSSMVKEIFLTGGCVEGMVPSHVIAALRARYAAREGSA
jgi:pantetheine-phosphate adenylyltransferase